VSILSLPRIHFTGFTDWSPSTANNAPNVYNEQDVEPFLQSGVTYDNYLPWLKSMNTQMQQPNGSWNVYGDHATKFANSVIKSAETEDGPYASDPFIGAAVSLQGLVYSDGPAPARLVMTDPFTGGEATSQIFYQWLVAGNFTGPQDQWIGFKAGAAGRMFSRFPYQTRNLGITFKEGMVGCIWQAAAYNKDIQWFGLDRSPLLTALKAAVTSGSNQGLLMRFASYATLYYQATYFNGKQILNGVDLVEAYSQGFTGDSPARSAMVGTFGIWEAGELATAPSGRLMLPGASPQLVPYGQSTAALGPAMAQVDASRNVLVVDFITTFPETDQQLDKANFGTLQLQARDTNGNVTPIAQLPPESYNRQAYEASGGISEFPLPTGMGSNIGTLELSQPIKNDTVVALRQTEFSAESDDRCVYVDQGQTATATIAVYANGGIAPPSMNLLLAQYDSNGNLLSEPLLEVVDAGGNAFANDVVPVANGRVTIGIRSLAPGACFLAFYPFRQQPPTSIPQTGIPLPSSLCECCRSTMSWSETRRTAN